MDVKYSPDIQATKGAQMMKVNLKLSVLVALLGLAIFICIPHTWAQNKADKDEKEKGANEVKIGFEIAPVPLNLKHKDRDLVGLGSYIVNAQGGCNDCHTYPNYKDGGNPFFGEPEQINTDHYMAGGRPFGPVVSRNITPTLTTGRPADLTADEFRELMRTGHDPDNPSYVFQVMPWPIYGKMTDHDLRAIYEYLSAIPHAEP
jgi:hypothetical protein